MSGEEWRPIPDWPDYMASDYGRVISHKRSKPRLLRQNPNTNGYPTVSLVGDGRQVTARVHRLVAAAFLGPCPDGLEVRHLDGDKNNNRASNLLYGTRHENMRDQVRLGVHREANKTACPRGHSFSEENTYVYKGWRSCRICNRARNRAYKIRRSLRTASVSTERAA